MLTNQRSGVRRLMAPRAITRPKGSASSRVRAKSCKVVPKPSSNVRVTDSSITDSLSLQMLIQQRNICPSSADAVPRQMFQRQMFSLLLDDRLLDAVGGGSLHNSAFVVSFLPEG